MILGVHFLPVKRGRAKTIQRVVADQIRLPLRGARAPFRIARIHVYQQRCIALHHYDVRIPFQPAEKRCITQRRSYVRCWIALPWAVGSPFAHKNLRPVAARVVVAIRTAHQPDGRVIQMIVDHIGFATGRLATHARWNRGNDL